jgi:isoleucyl-tRNA synthetase
MRANLPEMEPKLLARWKKEDLYHKVLDSRKDSSERFILHDGPPYANGHVHLGTALNKILKDFVVKSRSMMGQQAPYVPGWDCHGMPIEHNVIKELGDKAAGMPKLEIRKRCREYAKGFLKIQKEEFRRLGCLGDWERPYLTMSKHYESEIVAALGDLVAGKYIYRGLRPIHWCATCQTALAEAEVEYHDHKSPSIYVKFPIKENDPVLANIIQPGDAKLKDCSVLIWTTTPWTIPANLAIAVHPEYEYVFVKAGDEFVMVAADMLESVKAALNWQEVSIVTKVAGEKLKGMLCRHPMFERDSLVILTEYVTLDAGTGCVHTAPGHGADDFDAGKANNLEILSPVDEAGRFTKEVPGYTGQTVFEANDPICKQLKESNHLLGRTDMSHSYPFCWRCKQPLIFRATEQWFLDVDENELRQKALDEIQKVTWIPSWGHQRIGNMVETRPDWCLSRQRSWGVPIPAVSCKECGETVLESEVVEKARQQMAERGSDVWYQEPVEAFIPQGMKCQKCGAQEFSKKDDILDVWFDSSVSQRAVLESHPDLSWPCDLYLEATDQHRGWFQVSLLTAVGTRQKAPYRQVLTHGLILDENSKKMSKSLGNVIQPQEVIDKYGADVLRLLFSSVDYTADIAFYQGMIEPIADAYRKIRNTLRFIFGNLNDFDPNQNSVVESEMLELDRWVVARMRQAAKRVKDAYLAYQFHHIHHQLLDLCTVDLSAFYMDVTKDRLYVDGKDSLSRRSAQTALYQVAVDLITMLAPVLSYSAEEAWEYLPADERRPGSVHLAFLPEGREKDGDLDLLERIGQLRKIRAEINKALDVATKAKTISSSLDVNLSLSCDPDTRGFLESFGDLRDVLKVAKLEYGDIAEPIFVSDVIEGFKVAINTAEFEKCERCWNRREDVGRDQEYPTLCNRCTTVIK